MSPDKLTDLLEYASADGRICPNPQGWNTLYEMLPDKKRGEGGWDPPLPFFLSVWWFPPALPKIMRLEEHMRFAAEHQVLD